MDTTEPIGAGAKVNPATGMCGCSLYPIYPERQAPADTEPLDLDAIEADIAKYNPDPKRGSLTWHLEALIAEVRRLREGIAEAVSECNPSSSYSKADIAEILTDATGGAA